MTQISTQKMTKKDIENLKPLMEDMNPHPDMTGLKEAVNWQNSVIDNTQSSTVSDDNSSN
jgi:hypothetical protein